MGTIRERYCYYPVEIVVIMKVIEEKMAKTIVVPTKREINND